MLGDSVGKSQCISVCPPSHPFRYTALPFAHNRYSEPGVRVLQHQLTISPLFVVEHVGAPQVIVLLKHLVCTLRTKNSPPTCVFFCVTRGSKGVGDLFRSVSDSLPAPG